MSSQEVLVIDGAPARHLFSALREVWVFRGSILAFAERNVRVKYKQAILGVAWAVIQPLAFMAIFVLTVGRLVEVPTGGVPYSAFTLSALVPWTFLSTGVTFGVNALLTDPAMVRRVYFPREVPVLASVVAAYVDLAIGLAVFALLGPMLGAHVSAWWLIVPLLSVPLAALAAAVGTPLAALTVYYRDFRFVVPFAIQVWLFASPVAYPISVISERWRNLYAAVNPAAGILDAFSRVLAAGMAPDWALLGISTLSTLVIGAIGYEVFKRLEPGFADVI